MADAGERADLGELYDAALPHDAPGAWIRAAIEDRTTGERVEQLLGDEPPASSPLAERERAIARARAWIDEYHQPGVGPDFDLLSYIARGRTYAGELVRLLEQVDR